MKQSPIDQAKQLTSRSVIEAEFGSDDSYWTSTEFWTRNPSREDGSVGSFSINTEGSFNDFSSGESGGDIIRLVALRDGISDVEAARYLLNRYGNGSYTEASRGVQKAVRAIQKPSKPSAEPKYIPAIPDAADAVLKTVTASDGRTIGTPSAFYKYTDEDGNWLFSVVRFEGKDGKEIRPYKWNGSTWSQGLPMKTGRPLYGLYNTSNQPELPVLIVEGEKCADVQVDGYAVVTWCGGSNAVDKADWSPLEDRDLVIWPDNDDAGRKAARWISQNVKAASVRILDIVGKPEKWDIADASEEDLVLPFFIEANTRTLDPPRVEDQKPRFYFTHVHDIALRNPDWLIKGIVERGKLAEIFADPGSAKTFMALDWCFHVAAGMDWHGKKVDQGPVFYICGEGQHGVRRRIEALAIVHQ